MYEMTVTAERVAEIRALMTIPATAWKGEDALTIEATLWRAVRDLLLALDAASAERKALTKRAKALSLDDAVKFAGDMESEIEERLRWFQIVAALQIDLQAAEAARDAALAQVEFWQKRDETVEQIIIARDAAVARLKAAREHVADCFHCQQRGVCEEVESMLQQQRSPSHDQ